MLECMITLSLNAILHTKITRLQYCETCAIQYAIKHDNKWMVLFKQIKMSYCVLELSSRGRMLSFFCDLFFWMAFSLIFSISFNLLVLCANEYFALNIKFPLLRHSIFSPEKSEWHNKENSLFDAFIGYPTWNCQQNENFNLFNLSCFACSSLEKYFFIL